MLPAVCKVNDESGRFVWPCPGSRLAMALGLAWLWLCSPGGQVVAQDGAVEDARADVVVLVDTSVSMSEFGMDPERASLLVTKLLSDIVPGELAVARLLDLVADKDLLPGADTGVEVPCDEDPTQMCNLIEPSNDWFLAAREEQHGILRRSSRGDRGFKERLESHLEQRCNNSMFSLAFPAALGVFDEHLNQGVDYPRTIIWLSDGNTALPQALPQYVSQAQKMARVEAILFGRGDETLPRSLGLDVRRGASPGGLMRAFAGAFRSIVRAPYEIDAEVSRHPNFDMKRHIDEAWVVIYGDPTLESARLTSPDGDIVEADYAADRWPTAGAYRVAYLRSPDAGSWTVQASKGGSGVAYAVVQRSALRPGLLSPQSTSAGIEVPIEVGVMLGSGGELLTDPDLLSQMRTSAVIEGRDVPLSDDGTGGDRVAGDGIYTGVHSFSEIGEVPVRMDLVGDVVDAREEARVNVQGSLRFLSDRLDVDFGELGVSDESCRPLRPEKDHQGAVPVRLVSTQKLPSGHELRVESPRATWNPDGEAKPLTPADTLQVCLTTGPRVRSSSSAGDQWLALEAPGSGAGSSLGIYATWEVEGLTFWQRWGKWILLTLGILLLIFIILGFVLPHRFNSSLALAFAPERDELDELSPQPVKQWRGVGIGFYRDARACLHPDFRISGKTRGALAILVAGPGRSVWVRPAGGSLWRETLEGDWEPVASDGIKGRSGHVFRVSDGGPYFRLSTRGS